VIRGTLRVIGYTLVAALVAVFLIACAGGGFILGLGLAVLNNG
jgi:hypothetical protein